MSYTYEYVRDVVNGRYDIDRPERETRLANEVETALPGKQFVVKCNSASCKVIFQQELTVQEKADLDQVVYNHKNNL